jgi:hypothetical protein
MNNPTMREAIEDLKSSKSRHERFIAENQPSTAMTAISDGDFLVSTGDNTGPFVDLTEGPDGREVIEAGLLPITSSAYEASHFNHCTALDVAKIIFDESDREEPLVVVKLVTAVEAQLEMCNELLHIFKSYPADKLDKPTTIARVARNLTED